MSHASPSQAGKEEVAIDPDLGPSPASQADGKSGNRQLKSDRSAIDEQGAFFRTLDMLQKSQQRCDALYDRLDQVTERAQAASDRAVAKELEVSRLQQKVEQLQRAFEDADDHEDHGRARKRSRTATQDDAASQASPRTTGFNQQVPPSLASRIGELEAKIVELEQVAVAARRSAEETLAERDGKIVELENREQAATAAVQEAQKTIQAGLQKNEWLEQTIDELEVFEKRALVADKTIEERETEIEELKTQVAELERVAPVAPGPCQDAAHAAAVIAVERLTLKAERLQREHDAIAQMRVTLEGWMPNIAKIRSLVTSCSGGKPSKDAVALHKWVINQAETMEELCGELTWAQSENDAAGPAN